MRTSLCAPRNQCVGRACSCLLVLRGGIAENDRVIKEYVSSMGSEG